MAQAQYLSVSAIAKLLDVPESTLHYWKNRFADYLPVRGQGRSRRFEPEAVEVFRAIAAHLAAGLSVEDVRTELARRVGESADAQGDPAGAGASEGTDADMAPAGGRSPGLGRLARTALADRLGALLGQALSQALAQAAGTPQAQSAAGGEDVAAVAQSALDPQVAHGLDTHAVQALEARLAANEAALATLMTRNKTLESKLGVLEAELIRLRKEGREREKALAERLRALRAEGQA